MSWSASTGLTHRYELWQAIDALTATQDGLDSRGQEQLFHQLHGAKAAAKALCNTFDVGEWPTLFVTIGGHVHTGPGSAGNFVNVSVSAPTPVVEPEPSAPVAEEEQSAREPEQEIVADDLAGSIVTPSEPAQE